MQTVTYTATNGDTFIFRGVCKETRVVFARQATLFAANPNIGLSWSEAAFLVKVANGKHKPKKVQGGKAARF